MIGSSAYATTIFCVMEVAVCELITGQHNGIIYLLLFVDRNNGIMLIQFSTSNFSSHMIFYFLFLI